MKRVLVFILIVSFFVPLQGMLVEFVEDGVSTNRFLSEYVGGTCPSSSTNSGVADCGNSYIYNVIGTNFVEGTMLTLGTYYIYNDFGAYVEAMSRALNNTAAPGINNTSDSFDQSLQDAKDKVSTTLYSGDSNDAQDAEKTTIVSDAYQAYAGDTSDASLDPKSYPAVGVYQIELSTASSVQATVLPEVKPEEGQVKLVARLRYSGGKSYSQDDTQGVYLWSQDAICLSPTDSFKIVVSSDVDDTAKTDILSEDSSSSGLILNNYFGYNNTTIDDCPAYESAISSPRKIRLEIVS